MKHAAGHSLPEVLVALVFGSLLIALVVAALSAQAQLAALAAERFAVDEAMLTTWAVLGAELRHVVPHTDVRASARDSLRFRIFRGLAVPCGAGVYGYDGMRRPDAAKDSVLAAGSGAAARLVALESAGGQHSGCAARHELLLRVQTEPPLDSEPLLFFESGSYFLTAGALRYRLGAEGRQPLTAELFDDAQSWLAADGLYAFDVRLGVRRAGPLGRYTQPLALRFFTRNAELVQAAP